MSKLKKFNEFVNENLVNEVEQLIVENAIDFVDQKELSRQEIDNFRQQQAEILQRYPSLSDLDKQNITDRMDSIIADKTDNIETANVDA